LGNSLTVLMSLTFKWTRYLVTCNDASRFPFSPLNWQCMARYGCFLSRKQRCPINMYFFESISYTAQVSSKQCGQAAPFLLL
jgi:hypothetical protein